MRTKPHAEYDSLCAWPAFVGVVPFLSLCIATHSTHAQQTYWTEVDIGVRRADADGSDVRTIIPDPKADVLLLDRLRGHIYWTDRGCCGWCSDHRPGFIKRAKFDGTEVTTLYEDWEGPRAIAIDHRMERLCWIALSTIDIIYDGQLRCSNLDGSDPQVLLELPWFGSSYSPSLRADPPRGVLYWAVVEGISRTPIADPGAQDTVRQSEETPLGLEVDPVLQHIYWSEGQQIFRANLDGSDLHPFIATEGLPRDLALDQPSNKLYWSEGTRILRVNLDGTDVEQVIETGWIRSIAVDPRVKRVLDK